MSDKTLCMQRDTFAVRVQHNKTTYDDVARRSALTAQLGVSALCMVLNEESSFLRAPVPVDSRRVPLKSSAAVLHLHLCDFFTRFAVPNRKQKYCHDENVHYKHRSDAQGTIRQRGYGAAGEATVDEADPCQTQKCGGSAWYAAKDLQWCPQRTGVTYGTAIRNQKDGITRFEPMLMLD